MTTQPIADLSGHSVIVVHDKLPWTKSPTRNVEDQELGNIDTCYDTGAELLPPEVWGVKRQCPSIDNKMTKHTSLV